MCDFFIARLFVDLRDTYGHNAEYGPRTLKSDARCCASILYTYSDKIVLDVCGCLIFVKLHTGMPGGAVPAGGPVPRAANAAAAAARGRAGPGRPLQVRMRVVQVNLRALLQLAVMGIILYQVQECRCSRKHPLNEQHCLPM